jgi:Holliday junction DNA helicase RuvA
VIARVAGQLEHVDAEPPASAMIRVAFGDTELSLEVLIPSFLSAGLALSAGTRVELHTLTHLESMNQGASFTPRLLGFATPEDRRFFELLTTVKGIGPKKALRVMAEPVSKIALLIERGDAKGLSGLPEIGKRMAETVIAELKGKCVSYAASGVMEGAGGTGPGGAGMTGLSAFGARKAVDAGSRLPPMQRDAVEALVRMGDVRAEAERKVGLAAERLAQRSAGAEGGGPTVDVETLLRVVFSGVAN